MPDWVVRLIFLSQQGARNEVISGYPKVDFGNDFTQLVEINDTPLSPTSSLLLSALLRGCWPLTSSCFFKKSIKCSVTSLAEGPALPVLGSLLPWWD